MRGVIRLMLVGLAFLAAVVVSGFGPETHKIVIGAQETGTVQWELAAMKALGFDKKHNLEIEIRGVADAKAGQIALQAGEVDIILSDFVWVSIQRSQGNMISIVPHSLTVGGLLVDPEAGITKVEDLKGKTIAVSGSPVDKSWVILQAYYNSLTGGVLADEATVRFGAPPLVNEIFTGGEAQAALNLWNWNARAKLAGKTELISVWNMLEGLGVSEQPPLLGWAFTDATAEEKKDVIKAFLDASFDTKAALLTDDAVWDGLRDLMNATEDEALFVQLRDDYRAGIVSSYVPSKMQAAEESFALMAKYGGPDVTGSSPTLAEGTFWKGYRK